MARVSKTNGIEADDADVEPSTSSGGDGFEFTGGLVVTGGGDCVVGGLSVISVG